MSDLPTDDLPTFNARRILADIDRTREETLKFVAEQHKLMAEARKFGLDPWLIVAAGLLAILAGLTARLPEILRAFGLPG